MHSDLRSSGETGLEPSWLQFKIPCPRLEDREEEVYDDLCYVTFSTNLAEVCSNFFHVLIYLKLLFFTCGYSGSFYLFTITKTKLKQECISFFCRKFCNTKKNIFFFTVHHRTGTVHH